MSAPKERHKVIPAVYVIFRDGDEVLLIRRANTGYHDGDYSLPAGHLDGGEPAVAAAAREAKEEVGVDIIPQDLQLVHTMHRQVDGHDRYGHERVDLFFEAAKWRGELKNAEPQKCDELKWSPLKNLPKNMIPEVHFALERIAAGEPYSDFNF